MSGLKKIKNKMDTTKILLKFLPSFLRKKIENNEGLQKIIDNINWLGGEKMIQLLIGVFVGAFIARYLGPEQLGRMSYASAFVGLFAVFGTLGLDAIVVRNIVNNPGKEKEYLGSTIILRFIGSSALLVFSMAGIMLLRPGEPMMYVFVVIIAGSYLVRSFETIDLWFQSQVKSKFIAQSRSLAFLITSALKVLFVVTQQPLIAFVLMFLLDSIIAAVLLIFFYQKNGQISIGRWKARFKTMKELLKDSWPLILSGVSVAIYMRIDQVMIGSMLGDADLGIYSVAVKLSEAWYFLPMIITSSVFPAILKARKKSRELYLARMQKLYDVFTWLTIPIAIITALLSPYIIGILFGDEFIQASLVLSILIFSGVFVFLGVASSKYLVSENQTKTSFYRTFIGLIINIVLNIILIPKYGITGSAIATLISYAFASCVANLFFKESRIIFFMQTRSFNIVRIIKEL